MIDPPAAGQEGLNMAIRKVNSKEEQNLGRICEVGESIPYVFTLIILKEHFGQLTDKGIREVN